MMRQWLKILVLVVALLSQVAMSCPRDSGSSSPESAPSRGGY
jgi:hypothetical protein